MKPEHEQFTEARIAKKKESADSDDLSYFAQEEMPEDSDPTNNEEDD